MTDAANREMCADCPLWRSDTLSKIEFNEAIWLRLDDVEDRARLNGAEHGEIIMAAMAYPHPERCQQLRSLSQKGVLPPAPRRRPRAVASSECPEHRLLSLFFDSYPEDI